MPKVYSGPHQDFYRVWEKADKSLVIEVLHSNKIWRNRLLGSNPHVHKLLHDVCTPKENKIRAAAILFEVIQDFPEAFRHGRVAFTTKHPYPLPLTPDVKPPEVASVIRSHGSTAQYQHQPCGAGAGSTAMGVLDSLAGRAFFYREIYRLRSTLPEALTRNAGLYAVLQQDERLGQPIDGLPPNTPRCVKIGMSDLCVKTRILSQYFGKSQRTAILRRLVGDALIGRAMREQHDLAGFPSTSLSDVRMLWNAGGSPSRAIQCQHGIALKFNLFTDRDLTDFESALECKVTAYMNDFRFIALSANPEDVSQIEDAANSLLRDVAAVDPASVTWLGHSSSREAVRQYGLWATVGVTRKYRPYTEHEWKLKGRDDQGRPVADWLLLLREIIDKELTTGL